MTLNANLPDDAPMRNLLTATSATQLPALTSSNSLALARHFGVAQHRPGHGHCHRRILVRLLRAAGREDELRRLERRRGQAMFVSSKLGFKVKVFSTTNTLALPPGTVNSRAPVTITGFRKGSVAEGQKIVLCHVVNFRSSLYYCHRVTGTKVMTAATLQPSASNAAIQAVGVCHIDTSLWLSTHPAFSALNIPRGDEACHRLVDSHLAFVPTTDNGDVRKE